MELKNVFIDAGKSLGNITFAGAGKENQTRANGRRAVTSRTYSLYSDVQRADNVEVTIPGKAGVKHFEYEEPVALINPRVEIEGYAINNRGYVNYKIYADDIISVDELKQEEIRFNPKNRCYLCKKSLFSGLLDFARAHDAAVVMEGTNQDDLKQYRPGIQAVKELGVKSPLMEAGFTKAEIRAYAKELDISVAERPSSPCLATRLPYGTARVRKP